MKGPYKITEKVTSTTEFAAGLWTHALCAGDGRGTAPTTIAAVRCGMHADRAARTAWLSHTALDTRSDLSGKACVCRAGLGRTKLKSLLNFLVGSSQQQLSSMLKKFIFEICIYTVECNTCFPNQCFPPPPSLWRSGLQCFQSWLRLRI